MEGNRLAILCGRNHLTPTVRAILARLAPLGERAWRDALTRRQIPAGLRRAARRVLEEVRAMPLQVDVERDPYLAELVRKGQAEALARGRAQGEAAALLRVAERRFGPLPADVRERIAAADPETVDGWLDRVMDAASLEELLAARPARPASPRTAARAPGWRRPGCR